MSLTEFAVYDKTTFDIADYVEVSEDKSLTMSSIKIVELINMLREEGAAELQHRDFTRKVPKVLGEDNAAKFYASQIYGNNNTRNIYNLPKRESMLMLMSYSYDIQALVYDKMVQYETMLKNGFKLPSNYKQALQALLKAEEDKEQLQLERDEAVKRQNYLDSKRAATSMNKASQLSKKLTKIESERNELVMLVIPEKEAIIEEQKTIIVTKDKIIQDKDETLKIISSDYSNWKPWKEIVSESKYAIKNKVSLGKDYVKNFTSFLSKYLQTENLDLHIRKETIKASNHPYQINKYSPQVFTIVQHVFKCWHQLKNNNMPTTYNQKMHNAIKTLLANKE